MKARFRPDRRIQFALSLAVAVMLILLSASGTLLTFESLAALPLTLWSGALNQIALRLSSDIEDLRELQSLRQRVRDLEELVGQYQNEQIARRELQHDFERLAAQFNYQQINQDARYLAAETIATEASGLLRGIIINRGFRDGVAIGMPVVTDRGLVGRVVKVIANASQVLLITDGNSAVSARLQSSRAQGSVLGSGGGGLRMSLIPLNTVIQENDIVMTSGLGGNFPADLVLGRVASIRQFEFELFQEAELSSFIDFDRLETVLVITSFEPVDLSAFETSGQGE